MSNRTVVGLVVAVALFLASPGWASGQEQATQAPADQAVSEMEVDISSVAGRLQLFVGAVLGEPAKRRIGRSPELLSIRCQGQGADSHCVGTSSEKGEFWPGDCLILAQDDDEQEMILSGDLMCRKLDSLNKWELQLDFTQGTAVAHDLSNPPSGDDPSGTVSGKGSSSNTATHSPRQKASRLGSGVSVVPERFSRRLFDSKRKP